MLRMQKVVLPSQGLSSWVWSLWGQAHHQTNSQGASWSEGQGITSTAECFFCSLTLTPSIPTYEIVLSKTLPRHNLIAAKNGDQEWSRS